MGEKYDSHYDYFDETLYQNDANTLELIKHGHRNRLVTVFWYLSNVPQGGETVFPRFNGGHEKGPTDCETGLKVKPQAGKVIIFYSLRADGRGDSNSLHGACPVQQGTKWAANKWVWNEPMSYVSD
jgi:prolyl 4-hydroxylase